jgi:hypothetical protein
MAELTPGARELIRLSEEEYRSSTTGKEAPLEQICYIEVIKLFYPIFVPPRPGFISGKLWGMYRPPLGGLNRLLGHGLIKDKPNLAIADVLGDAQLFLSGPGGRLVKSKRNLKAGDAYETFAPPTGEIQPSSLPAVARLQADIGSALEARFDRLTLQTKVSLYGLLYWLGEWREGVFDFDAFTFWTVTGHLLRRQSIRALDGYEPDLEALRKRVQMGVFIRAKKSRSGWYSGPWGRMKLEADRLRGFFVRPELRPWKEEAERLRKQREEFGKAIKRGRVILAHCRTPDLSNRCGRCGETLDYPETSRKEWLRSTPVKVAYCRDCAEQLREGTEGPSLDDGPEREDETLQESLLHPAQPEANYSPTEKCDPRAIIRRLANELVDVAVPAPRLEPDAYYEAKKRASLIQASKVIPGGFPDAESLQPRLDPLHPRKIAREIVDRVRGWTTAALVLVDEATEESLFSDLDVEDEEGNTHRFKDSLAATPGAAWTVTESPDLDLNLLLHKEDVALWMASTKVGLTKGDWDLLKFFGIQRDLPMTEAERTRKSRAAGRLREKAVPEFNRLPQHFPVIPDGLDSDVKWVVVAEEGRRGKPPTRGPATPFQDAASIVSLDTVRSHKLGLWTRQAPDALHPFPWRYRDLQPKPLQCWLWDDGENVKGRPPSQEELRRVWRLVYGEIPRSTSETKYKVRQTCENRRCVNPDHLALEPPLPPWEGYTAMRGRELERVPELVKVQARGSLVYNGHHYKQGAQFYIYQDIAEAAVKVGAVEIREGRSSFRASRA